MVTGADGGLTWPESAAAGGAAEAVVAAAGGGWRAGGEGAGGSEKEEEAQRVKRGARRRPPFEEEVEAELLKRKLRGTGRDGDAAAAAARKQRARTQSLGRRLLEGAAGGTQFISEGAMNAARTVLNLDLDDVSLNPLALVLTPVQRLLGSHLVYVRMARGIYRWEDPALTAWVCAGLVVVALGMLPVVFHVLPRVPWPWVMAVVGVVLLGPQNILLGRRLMAERDAAAARESRWQGATKEEARAMLEAEVAPREERRREEEETRRARVQAAMSEEGRTRAEARSRLVESGYVLEVNRPIVWEKHPTQVMAEASHARPWREEERSPQGQVEGKRGRAGGLLTRPHVHVEMV